MHYCDRERHQRHRAVTNDRQRDSRILRLEPAFVAVRGVWGGGRVPGPAGHQHSLLFFGILSILVGRDVVHIDVLVLSTPVFVGIVEPSDWTFLDGAARTAIFGSLMRLSFVLGRGVRSEVAIPSRRLGAAARVHRPRTTEAARTRSAESARRARTRSAEAARPGPAESTTGTRAAWSTLFARPRFADRERTSLERLLVEPLDRLFGDGAIRVIDEREASRSSGLPIYGKHYRCGLADAGQVRAQLCLRGDIRQIANEQTD
jgi:hypothetical protein